MVDYHDIHGYDNASFDLPSTHRLPTVSAAQALQDLEGRKGSNFISTGIESLNAALAAGLDGSVAGGVHKGHVTEIWGPSGSGKTAFGIQLAATCLKDGRGVVWVDAFHPLPIHRLRSAVQGKDAGKGEDEGDFSVFDDFTHYTCPSLPHLIALLCRPTASCIPQGTALIVVDTLSALINHAFPKVPESRPSGDVKGNKSPPMGARRLQALQYIVGSLQKLAATRDVAIVVLTQCATKMQAERGATLVPAITATVWEQGMSTRLVLFRNWAQQGVEPLGLRFVGVQKLNGKVQSSWIDSVCAFRIEETGLVTVEYDTTQQTEALSSVQAQKRKLGDTDLEIADSEDEDYGWGDDDELPPMPSQWQGSEDLLLTREPESEVYEIDGADEGEEQEEDPDDNIKSGSNAGQKKKKNTPAL